MQCKFSPGDIVIVRNERHLRAHVVIWCKWQAQVSKDIVPYWLVNCEEIRDPIDWSKIPSGATGIITFSSWQGDAKHLEPYD